MNASVRVRRRLGGPIEREGDRSLLAPGGGGESRHVLGRGTLQQKAHSRSGRQGGQAPRDEQGLVQPPAPSFFPHDLVTLSEDFSRI